MKKKKTTSGIQVKDPYAKREAEKYESPIPSREFILNYLEKVGAPQQQWEIAAALALTSEEQLEALRRRLRAMERDAQLMCLRQGAYALVSKMDLIAGTVLGHRDGFGFLAPDDGSNDLFLSPGQMRGVFDGDRALARVKGLDRKGRREGIIVEVLAHNTQSLVGRLQCEAGVYYLLPDNKRITQSIVMNKDDLHGARLGQFVVVRIEEALTYHSPARGSVQEVLGEHMAPGMEIDVAIRSHGLRNSWPGSVLAEIEGLAEEVPEAAKAKRIDLRDTALVTIDGEDARDFDDAVFCEKKRSGWRLLVAIADVSHYVWPGAALDLEAAERGTSVYFPERVIPMLPEVLSNGLCSLNPQVDRLCLVCEMHISATGKITQYRFFEGVMNSKARLTYNAVGAMLTGTPEEKNSFDQRYPQLRQPLENLHQLYHVLRKSREQRGAIDFETTETRIIFGDKRKIERIVPVVRNDAHKIIEECMLCANVAAARFIETHQLPGLYRVHDVPDEDKVTALREFLAGMALSLPGKRQPAPADYQALLAQLQDRPERDLVQTVLLRSMKQAVYSPENKGHFGLAYSSYAHFTSPIRRYPDLLMHRAIRYLIRSRVASEHVERVKGAVRLPKEQHLPYSEKDMMELGLRLSTAERRADAATRDVNDWLKCEYMLDRVGDIYEGIISSVTGFGFFVQLTGIYVEGLVHISTLENDYYHFNATSHSLEGEHSGKRFRLADSVTVRVAAVNLDDRKIDFELMGQLSGKGAKKQKQSTSAPPSGERKNRSGKKKSQTSVWPKKASAENETSSKKKRRKKPHNKAKTNTSPKPASDQKAVAGRKTGSTQKQNKKGHE